jgi:CubicO group peptidase (beta-lactamase class C family)
MTQTGWRDATVLAEGLAASWQGGPGGVFVLFDTEGVRGAACGGLASLEHGIPFTPDTPSRYASISKHLLATCLLMHEVPLEAPLGSLLPDLPDAFAAVPLGRALDMTGGLPDMMEVQWQLGMPFTATLAEAEVGATLRRLTGTSTPPGAEMAYSNTGWRLG